MANVKGLAELQKLLDTLPAKIEANIMRAALRQGANVVRDEIKANIPVKTGTLKSGVRVSTRSRRGVVVATVKAGGPHAYIAPWLEFGTSAHEIVAKNAKALVLRSNVRATSGFANRWMNIPLVEAVHHPGIRPKPFMRPALDSQAGAALVAVGEAIKKRLTKQGLNTAGIDIEEIE